MVFKYYNKEKHNDTMDTGPKGKKGLFICMLLNLGKERHTEIIFESKSDMNTTDLIFC